jgi:hypothetical protein
MAKTTTAPFLQNTNNADGTILPADTTTKKTIFTAGANDSVVKSLMLASTDTAAMNVQLFVNVGGAGTDRLLATIPVPANSGNLGTVPSVDVLRSSLFPALSFDAFGNKIINLKAGSLLKAAVLVTVTAAKQIDIFGEAGDF